MELKYCNILNDFRVRKFLGAIMKKRKIKYIRLGEKNYIEINNSIATKFGRYQKVKRELEVFFCSIMN